MNEISISAAGCALLDFLYTDVDFSSPAIASLWSKRPGDGGILPGGLVFTRDLESFAGSPFSVLRPRLVGDRPPDRVNLGGPCIVALLHASQLLHGPGFKMRFHGARGNDEAGRFIGSFLKHSAIGLEHYLVKPGQTPSTTVLSGTVARGSYGERAFINDLGVAADYSPENLDDVFFGSDILFFGGTALVPHLHDSLEEVLLKGKEKDAVNVVSTVYDFRNEQKYPGRPWPLANIMTGGGYIDLLMMNREESLRISGQENTGKAGQGSKPSGECDTC